MCLSFSTFNQSIDITCALHFRDHTGSTKAQKLVTCILELNNNILLLYCNLLLYDLNNLSRSRNYFNFPYISSPV